MNSETRTLPFARMSRINAHDMDALGNDTFYTVWVRVPGKIRPYQLESEQLQTRAEALAHIKEVPEGWEVVAVFRHDYDVPRRDEREEIATLWLSEYEGERGGVPDFIEAHLSEDEIDTHFAEIDEQRAMRRELSSPKMTGRI